MALFLPTNLRLAPVVCAFAATSPQPGDLDLDCFFGHASLPRGICRIRSMCRLNCRLLRGC